MNRYLVTVEFRVEAEDEEAAVDLVQHELAARQEIVPEPALVDYTVRTVF